MQQPVDQLSSVFHALADPSRRAIIEHLARTSASVGDLAAPLPISRPAVSQHLAVLEEAGLITRTRQAQWRLCELTPEPLDAAADWVQHHRRLWTQRFDALDEVLRNAPTDPAAADADPLTPAPPVQASPTSTDQDGA